MPRLSPLACTAIAPPEPAIAPAAAPAAAPPAAGKRRQERKKMEPPMHADGSESGTTVHGGYRTTNPGKPRLSSGPRPISVHRWFQILAWSRAAQGCRTAWSSSRAEPPCTKVAPALAAFPWRGSPSLVWRNETHARRRRARSIPLIRSALPFSRWNQHQRSSHGMCRRPMTNEMRHVRDGDGPEPRQGGQAAMHV